MPKTDKDMLESISRDRKRANGYFGQKSAVFRAFLQMESAAFSDGALNRMEKELIALGISVVVGCESCMQWHIEQALVEGATQEQVIEAVGVGIEMGGGPATVSARFAMKVLEEHGGA